MKKEENNNYKAGMEHQVEIIAQAVARIEVKVDKLETKVDKLEIKVDEFEINMNERFDRVEASIGRRQQEIDGLRDNARVLTTRVDKMELTRA